MYVPYEDERAIMEMKQVFPLISAIVDHINAIKEEDDSEVINIYLDCIDEINQQMPEDWKKSTSVREKIKEGLGDYKEIQEKCIKLGVL